MADLANATKTHSIFGSSELPWIFRGEQKPDHLDFVELVRRSGIDLPATFEQATGRGFRAAENLSVTGRPLRFRRGQVIPIHTHVNDLRLSGTVVMLKRITTPGGAIFYTNGTDDEDNGYQELAENQWAVVDARRQYYGEVLQAESVPERVEMDLFSLSFVDADGRPVALTPEAIVACAPDRRA